MITRTSLTTATVRRLKEGDVISGPRESIQSRQLRPQPDAVSHGMSLTTGAARLPTLCKAIAKGGRLAGCSHNGPPARGG